MLLTQRDSGGHGPAVDPEGHPGEHDHQGGREVGLEQEEEDVATQREVDVQAVVPACGTQEEASEIPSQRQKQAPFPGALLSPSSYSSSAES